MSTSCSSSTGPQGRAALPGRTSYAVFGGIYNNHLALAAVLDDAARRGCSEVFCLGDLGGFGPHPNLVFPILLERGVRVMQGNYDHSIGYRLPNCSCGYTDPRDNHFARLSYAYTQTRTSDRWLPYLRELPPGIRTEWAGWRVLMAHGSPRRVNEFLWESACSDAFLAKLLLHHQTDVLLVTHSGIPWQRRLSPWLSGPSHSGASLSRRAAGLVVNVGAIGRPANDGRTEVYYALITLPPVEDGDGELEVELIPVAYDWSRLAHEMRAEKLPEEFVQTIETGFWTTCLEILPAKERSRGKF